MTQPQWWCHFRGDQRLGVGRQRLQSGGRRPLDLRFGAAAATAPLPRRRRLLRGRPRRVRRRRVCSRQVVRLRELLTGLGKNTIPRLRDEAYCRGRRCPYGLMMTDALATTSLCGSTNVKQNDECNSDNSLGILSNQTWVALDANRVPAVVLGGCWRRSLWGEHVFLSQLWEDREWETTGKLEWARKVLDTAAAAAVVMCLGCVGN